MVYATPPQWDRDPPHGAGRSVGAAVSTPEESASFEHHDGWHYAQHRFWIIDHPRLTPAAKDLYAILDSMTRTSRFGLRGLTMDQVRWLLTKPGRSPVGLSTARAAVALLRKEGLLEQVKEIREGKSVAYVYLVHDLPEGEYSGWKNGWEKLDEYHPDWSVGDEVESYPPVYRVSRPSTQKITDPARNLARKPVARQISGDGCQKSGGVSGVSAGQRPVSETPKRSFEEVKHEEETLTASGGNSAQGRGERDLEGSRPSIEEITGPGAVVAEHNRQRQLPPPERPEGHPANCLCAVCRTVSRARSRPSVPAQPSEPGPDWLDQLFDGVKK